MLLQIWHSTFIFVIVNLVVLYLILKKILFKPVTAFMENRTKSIKDSIESAQKAKIEADEVRQKYQEQMKNARSEADKMVNDAVARANKEYEAILAAAKQDAQKVLDKAREDIERERQQMVSEVKNQVASLAIAAASKVIEANMDTQNNRALVNKFIKEAGVA